MASEDIFQNECSEEPELEVEQRMETEDAAESEDETEAAATTEETSPAADAATEKSVGSKSAADHERAAKLTQLPLGRVKSIMKLDPDLHLATQEAVFTVTKAVELFIASLARESYKFTAQFKKKTVQKKDVDMAISVVDCLLFLDGALK
ncbi:DNA polymerase epsilon subunit 4 [Drosophila subobscura]|uniref:DNA polymerase epsilon subunit 4 n=1 Tax=Drosophila subobscura TaxID=7241 RepID=UPI00155A3DF6|nr:DNA polymerase epsilon subunit 4 [Drosophila subobscura]